MSFQKTSSSLNRASPISTGFINKVPHSETILPVKLEEDISFLIDTPNTNTNAQCIPTSIFPPHSYGNLKASRFWDKNHLSHTETGFDALAASSTRADLTHTDPLSSMDNTTTDASYAFQFDGALANTPALSVCSITPESLVSGSVDATPLLADKIKVPENTPVDALALGGLPAVNLEGFDAQFLNELLTTSMYESNTMDDPSKWEPLFPESIDAVTTSNILPAASESGAAPLKVAPLLTPALDTFDGFSSSPAHPAIETKFVHEKRSAVILAGEKDKEDELKSKKRRISAREFEDLVTASRGSAFGHSDSLSPASPSFFSTTGGSAQSELPPIVVDPSDRRAVKRARNTMAARRSREKKKVEVDELRIKVAEQDRIITELMTEVKILRSMVSSKQ